MNDRFYEDFEIGQSYRSEAVTLTESDIIDFALRYDPQQFHVDKRAAEQSHFGGLIASGWHVAALSFRMFAQAGILKGGAMGSPGLDKLRWLKPVRPGDTIHAFAEVIDRRDSQSRDDRGYVTLDFQVRNQDDDVVMSYTVIEILARRPGQG
ncbi:MAG: MaoC family dehydratase [Alphaproteobacteria bacterium]|nr:MaoC family dehydratase [Alphaproteobacteria bacterium]